MKFNDNTKITKIIVAAVSNCGNWHPIKNI